jgi:tryptophan-rich sensory protein
VRAFREDASYEPGVPHIPPRTELMALVGFVGLSLLVAAADASTSAARASAWYQSLPAPPLAPPVAVLQPVSLLLHLMLGLAAWRVWRRGSPALTRAALKRWGWLLLFDAAWSPAFFALHRPDLALTVVAPLLVLTGVTIHGFRRVDRAAAVLMFPYAPWMCYAGYLLAGFAWLNPG